MVCLEGVRTCHGVPQNTPWCVIEHTMVGVTEHTFSRTHLKVCQFRDKLITHLKVCFQTHFKVCQIEDKKGVLFEHNFF
jgi:hypothetical protein